MENTLYKLKKTFQIFTIVSLCFFSFTGNILAQQKGGEVSFEITSVTVDEQEQVIKAGLKITEKGKDVQVIGRNFDFFEKIDGERNILGLDRFIKLNGGYKQDTFSILFLIDISGSMRKDDRMKKSKDAILTTIKTVNLPASYQFYISAFDNDISPSERIDKASVDNVLGHINIRGKKYYDTDLYRAVIEKTQEFDKKPGKKVIILLSDGDNDTKNNPYYRDHELFSAQDAINAMTAVSEDFLICPIALGNKADIGFLKSLVATTSSRADLYTFSETAEELKSIFLRLVKDVSSDYLVLLNQLDPTCYKAEERELFIDWSLARSRQSKMYRAGSLHDPVCIPKEDRNWLYFLTRGLFGTLFVVLLLAGLRYLTPWIQQRQFRALNVKRYKHEPGTPRAVNSLVGEAIEDGEPVVNKCRRTVPLAIWEQLGHCPEYPHCMEFHNPCDGAGAPTGKGDFWSQQGVYKKLNWLWFGSLGGLIGWLLFAISQLTFADSITDLLENLFSGSLEESIASMNGGSQMLKSMDNLSTEILVGISVATGLVFALSWAAERGDSRGLSWKRIAFRTLLGFILSGIVFFFGFLMQYLLVKDPFFSGLIIWSVVGILIGIILSINSTIEATRAILGGILASIIGFLLYYLIGQVSFDFEASRLFGMIILGMVLGYIIVVVLVKLEDFELLIVKPTRFNGITKPISKWLRKGMEITIGTSQKCHIVIKWDDPDAEPIHARMSYKEGKVFIEPLHEMLLNGVLMPLEVKRELRDNDLLKFGRESVSTMQYKEKHEFVGKSKKSLISRLFSKKK
ncbi:MAG: hypothetical protein ACI85O_001466 [Saprospiraceae bacterium]|jgi:hypothetical protein